MGPLSGLSASRYYPAGSFPTTFAAALYTRPHPPKSNDTGLLWRRKGVATGFGAMNDNPTYIGTRDVWDTSVPVTIRAPDRRHHVYIIGKTGSGKTTLLRNLILQHVAAGDGVGLIDPHGDLAEELLHHIPPNRADDLVYFNPGDLEHPVGLNLLADVAPDDRALVAAGIVSSFKSIWRDSWGPRLEYILYNAVIALLHCPNTSLLGVNRLLTDDSYRAWVCEQVSDPFIRQFWAEEYESYDPRFRREAIAPIQNKLGQFLLNPVIRNILGQVRTKISIRFMMDERRLLIANLSKGKLGSDKANLLGCLLATQFQLAAMSRADQAEDDRGDFYLFVDEFHNFATDSFAAILSEARKYRLCLTLSHQYIDQLALPIRQAVFGNVGTLMSFGIGYADAEALHSEFAEAFVAHQFVDLGRFEMFVRLLENGVAREPFRARALPPINNPVGRPAKLIARSREKYAAPRRIVEAKLNRWITRYGSEQRGGTIR